MSTPPDPSRSSGPAIPISEEAPTPPDRPAATRQEDAPLIVLAQLPDGVLILDREWRITFANDEARRIGNIKVADFNSRTQWELYPESLGTPFEAATRECMTSSIPATLEFFFPPTQIWVDARILPLPDGIALYYRDITAQKLAESLRQTATHQLQQVLEATTDSIVCIDRDWKCTFANRAAHQILKTVDLVGMDLWTDFPGNQSEPFASNYRRTMAERVPTEFEAYYPAPLDIWFKVQAQPYDDDGIIIFSNEITTRKRAETLRDAYARRLDQVLEVTTDAIGSFDRDWTITFANDRACALLQRSDLVGKNLWEAFPAAVDSVFAANYRITMEQRIPTEFEAFYPEPLNRWYSQQCRPSEEGIVVFFRDITESREAEIRSRQQRDLITFVQQSARIAFWTLDLATYALTFDPGSYPVYGHPFPFLSSLDNLRSVFHPDDRLLLKQTVQHAVDTGEFVVVEFRVLDPQGNLIWLEGRAKTTVLDGKPVALGGMTIDISTRKQNEEALAASEERYRILTELGPHFIWTAAPSGGITYANQAYLDYLGLTFLDVSGDRWIHAIDPEDRNRARATWANSVGTGVDFELEARLLSDTGEARWCWLRAQPLRDQFGSITQWLGVCLDIHERKTASDALSEKQLETERQRAEIEAVYRTAPIGLALFDPVEFRFLRLNDRQAHIVGLPPDQILGRTVTDIAPIPGLNEMFQQVANGKPIRNALIQGELSTSPGEHRYWNVNYFPVFNPDGSVQAISAASLEITNQKKAENALIQSEKLAAVGRLASSISHEINNPLEAVTNLLYLIQHSDDLSQDVRLYVNSAQSELQRVCQIATQTLRFHRQAVRATLVTPRELIEAVVNLYQGRLANSGITVRSLYRNTRPILCFENDIRQVLNNLIANAIDAMRHGGSLLIRAYDAIDFNPSLATPTPRHGIRITIADNGHGMSPAVRARVFEPFYTTKDLNGTGLGLWISSGIIARHHGHISLRSSVDPAHHGTIFSIFLPHIAESEIEESNPHTV
jgi:PAS domain S-box-containing protein